jgi:hypothetical protein
VKTGRKELTVSDYDLTRYVEVGDCHEWTGPFECGPRAKRPIINVRNSSGGGLKLAVPRLVWLAAGRSIPAGRIVYRHCCNDACIRLEHLRCGPRGDQLKRRAALGLATHMQSTRASLTRAARCRSTTKYSEAQAAQVRELAAAGVRDDEISRRTGVGAAMVADIRRGEAWRPSMAAASVFGWRPAA